MASPDPEVLAKVKKGEVSEIAKRLDLKGISKGTTKPVIQRRIAAHYIDSGDFDEEVSSK